MAYCVTSSTMCRVLWCVAVACPAWCRWPQDRDVRAHDWPGVNEGGVGLRLGGQLNGTMEREPDFTQHTSLLPCLPFPSHFSPLSFFLLLSSDYLPPFMPLLPSLINILLSSLLPSSDHLSTTLPLLPSLSLLTHLFPSSLPQVSGLPLSLSLLSFPPSFLSSYIFPFP